MNKTPLDLEEDTGVPPFKGRVEFLRGVYSEWWKEWFFTVFDSLVPLRKWRVADRNVQIGDIVLLKFERKLVRHEFRYGRVLEVTHDTKGLVRTCVVGVRPRDSREKVLPYVPKQLLRMTVPVQRLVVVCPNGTESVSLSDIVSNDKAISDKSEAT